MKLTLERIEELRQSFHPTHAEALALLDSARALARLEEWLTEGRSFAFERRGAVNGFLTECGQWISDARKSPDLASAIHAALDEAEARK